MTQLEAKGLFCTVHPPHVSKVVLFLCLARSLIQGSKHIYLSILFQVMLETLSNENVNVPDIKNDNRNAEVDISLFQCSDSTNSCGGS